MDELHQLMCEHEQQLEQALDNMEFGAELTQDEVDMIRFACGKPRKPNQILSDVFDDFGSIFGGAA